MFKYNFMKNKILNGFLKIGSFLAVLFFPFLVSAELAGTNRILMNAEDIINRIIVPLAFTLAVLFFFWGMAKYIQSAGDEKAEGKKMMVWGVVALFVMSSVWGLVYFIRDELGLDDASNMKIPTIQK